MSQGLYIPSTSVSHALKGSEKWGDSADIGFALIPDLLIRNQAELGMTATELVVLINVVMHWWYSDRNPFPSSVTIAKRMAMDRRTVQRALSKLEKLGLLGRNLGAQITKTQRDKTTYDLSPLVRRLNELARKDPAFYRKTREGHAKL
jgi:predicted transcriptional regulator